MCTIEDVIDECGNSTKADYLLDCCYVLEVLELGELDPATSLHTNEFKFIMANSNTTI